MRILSKRNVSIRNAMLHLVLRITANWVSMEIPLKHSVLKAFRIGDQNVMYLVEMLQNCYLQMHQSHGVDFQFEVYLVSTGRSPEAIKGKIYEKDLS